MKIIKKYQEGNPIEGLDAWEERERKRLLQLRNGPGLTPIYPEFDLLLGARGLINGAVKEGIKQVPRAAKYIYNAAKKLPYSKTAHNFMTGMISGLTVDNLNKQLFGKSWGESVSEPVGYVVRKAGWNPDDTLWGRMLANIGTTAAEFTNPGYLLSPAGAKQIGETAYKGLQKLKPTFGYVRGGNTGGTKLYTGLDPEIIGIGKNLPGSQEIEISPEDLYKILQLQDGYYFLGHGTGRTNVSPEEIFNSGLRIKGAEISNTTTPISESRLRAWPHLNSENVIILPGKADMVRYDFPYGQIPTDWYNPKIFSWNDNPKVIGRGLLARQEPNASFIFENDGVVHTKPEAILGAYNTKTHILKLNPNSQYKFQFVETSATPLITVGNVVKMKQNSNISEAERLGIPKGERNNGFVKAKTSVDENITRLNNLGRERIRFMLDHPIYDYHTKDPEVSFENQLEKAQRKLANNPKFKSRTYKNNILYNVPPKKMGAYGRSESSLYSPDRIYDPNKKWIQVYNSPDDISPFAKITDSHEVKHFTGHDADYYIYEYLKLNGIINDSKMSDYAKSADLGEIGMHIGELADFLGATKPFKSNKYYLSDGRLSATVEDLDNYILFMRSKGLYQKGNSLYENILDKQKFIDFFNEFRFKQGGKLKSK